MREPDWEPPSWLLLLWALPVLERLLERALRSALLHDWADRLRKGLGDGTRRSDKARGTA